MFASEYRLLKKVSSIAFFNISQTETSTLTQFQLLSFQHDLFLCFLLHLMLLSNTVTAPGNLFFQVGPHPMLMRIHLLLFLPANNLLPPCIAGASLLLEIPSWFAVFNFFRCESHHLTLTVDVSSPARQEKIPVPVF